MWQGIYIMKLLQTPSLITGAILGASLITLSAASNDSALGGLHVFVPGTTVSSADVNDNFTMVVDEVSALEGRVDNLEGSSSETVLLDFFSPILFPGENPSNMSITVPQGYTYRMLAGQVIYDVSGNGNTGNIYRLNADPAFDEVHFGFPTPQTVSVEIEGMAQATMSVSSQEAFDVYFLPGTTITFEAKPTTPWMWTNLYVQIEKSPYNAQ